MSYGLIRYIVLTILFVLCQCTFDQCNEDSSQFCQSEISSRTLEFSKSISNLESFAINEELAVEDQINDDPNDQHIINSSSRLSNVTFEREILIVSTLDGIITALDTEQDGNMLWQIQTGPGGLVSSGISKVEMNSNGKTVRLIPSLSGGLYKFDGEGIEPIQMSADSLLHSSYMAADDLLITGAKEIRTYGVNAMTGHVQYTCTLNGCKIEPSQTSMGGQLLIVRRHNQFVRAIDPKSGVERWNFSVGRHEATLLYSDVERHLQTIVNQKANEFFPITDPLSEKGNYENKLKEKEKNQSALKYKISVPDGIILASLSEDNLDDYLWKYQFDKPIVHTWSLKDGVLTLLDTLSLENVHALEPTLIDSDPPSTFPLLYVGLYNHQLYVQESPRLRDLSKNDEPRFDSELTDYNNLVVRKKFRWLSPTQQESMENRNRLKTRIADANPDLTTSSKLISYNYQENIPEKTALSIRQETYLIPSSGVYVFEDVPAIKIGKSANEPKDLPVHGEEEELWEGGRNNTVHIVIVSLWFWWREVVLISLVTALVFHVFITRQVVYVLQQRWFQEFQNRRSLMSLSAFSNTAEVINATTIIPVEGVEQETPTAIVQNPDVPSSCEKIPSPYVSRYLTDFEPIQCLGKGGFGLVFEVRNRLDDCHYAVKRIQLPNTESAREKVMREVKALAKLDNPHIVRYFHAWIECPPPGWQESQDASWLESASLTGPTPFNSGEDSSFGLRTSLASSRQITNDFSSEKLGNLLKSIDKARQDLKPTEESIEIVFEDSNESSESCSISHHKERVIDETLDSSSNFHNDSLVSVARFPQSTHELNHSNRKSRRNNSSKGPKMYLYIQMQLCRKESLREWLRAQVSDRDVQHVLLMFNDIVRAVEYVHLQGLIHRDLKPSNIFFAPDGSVKIGDFGLVTAMIEEAYILSGFASDGISGRFDVLQEMQKNHTDQVGTHLYMSPEQIEGKPYSYKVDIYSLGLILFELLWPLSTQMEQVTVLSRLRDLNLPAGFDDKFPEEAKLLLKMIARQPDERPTTFGIRASPSLLRYQDVLVNPIPEHLHYNLQSIRRTME